MPYPMRKLSKDSVSLLIKQYLKKQTLWAWSPQPIKELQDLVALSQGDEINTLWALKCFYPSEFDQSDYDPGVHARTYIVLAGLMRLAFGLELPEKPQKLDASRSVFDKAIQSPGFMIYLLEEMPSLKFSMDGASLDQKNEFLINLYSFFQCCLGFSDKNKQIILKEWVSFLSVMSQKNMLSPENWNAFMDCFVNNNSLSSPYRELGIFRSLQFFVLLNSQPQAFPPLDQDLYSLIIQSDESVKRTLQTLVGLQQQSWFSNFKTLAEGRMLFLDVLSARDYVEPLDHVKRAWIPLMQELPSLLKTRLETEGPKGDFAEELEAWIFKHLNMAPIEPFQQPEGSELIFRHQLNIGDIETILGCYLKKPTRAVRPLEGEPLKLQHFLNQARDKRQETVDASVALNFFWSVNISESVSGQPVRARAYFILYNLLRLAKGLSVIDDARAPYAKELESRHLEHFKPLIRLLETGCIPLWGLEGSAKKKEELADAILSLLSKFFEAKRDPISVTSFLGVLSRKGLLNLENLARLDGFIQIHHDEPHFGPLNYVAVYDRLCAALFKEAKFREAKSEQLTQKLFWSLTDMLATQYSYPVFKQVFLADQLRLSPQEKENLENVHDASAVYMPLHRVELLIALYHTKKRHTSYSASSFEYIKGLCRLEKLRAVPEGREPQVAILDALMTLEFSFSRVNGASCYIILEGIVAHVFGYFDSHVKDLRRRGFARPSERTEMDEFVVPMLVCLLRAAPSLFMNRLRLDSDGLSFKTHLMKFLYVCVKDKKQTSGEVDLTVFVEVLQKLSERGLLSLDNIKKLSELEVPQVLELNRDLAATTKSLSQTEFLGLLGDITKESPRSSTAFLKDTSEGNVTKSVFGLPGGPQNEDL